MSTLSKIDKPAAGAVTRLSGNANYFFMPQPEVSTAPLQHGLYALVREMYPDRHADLETHTEAMGRARYYLYFRERVTESAEGWVRSMGSGKIVEMFSQNADVLRREGFKPALDEGEQGSLASFIWQTTLLGEARGDFYALTDFSYLSYLYQLEKQTAARRPHRHEEILIECMNGLLRSGLAEAEARRIFEWLEGSDVNPPFSSKPGCSLLTHLSAEMLHGGVRLCLRLPYARFMPNMPRLLILARENTPLPLSRSGT